MLESLIVICPGILAVLIYLKFNKKIQWPSLLAYIIFYVLGANFLVLMGLKLIGMQKFNLFEMSTRFKIKWIALEFILALPITWVIRSISSLREKNLSSCKKIMKGIFPATFFFIVTYAVFTPSSLFLGNINEFSIHYINVFPVILFVSLISLIGINVVALFFFNENNAVYCSAFIFSLTLALYIQGNFLNPKLSALDGTEIDWSLYSHENITSALFWVLCIFVTFSLVFRFKEKTETIIKCVSYFLGAVQLASLIVMLFTNKLDETATLAFSKDNEFTLGSEENIIIFLIDTLQGSAMEEYITSEAYTEGLLDDFTFFDNIAAGGAPTRVALPLLLSGCEYDPMQPIEAYHSEIWDETQLYNDLKASGYDIRFFTDCYYMPGNEIIDNYIVTENSWIDDYPLFGSQLYKLVNFYLMPQCLKEFYWLSDDKIKSAIKKVDTCYDYDDAGFYNELMDTGALQTDFQKSFRFYHLSGVHSPYRLNENLERVDDNTVTEQQTLRGIMKIIYAYIDEMKKAGVYNSSTIVITGDHGRHQPNNIESNPALLIKLPHETHALAHNSAPVHFRNFAATLAGTIMEDYSAYGPSFYDITENSDVEWLHTIDLSIRNRIEINEAFDESLDYTRFILSGKADSGEYKVWNPYQINCIDYPIGDKIDFTTGNSYAKQINYRLYKENNMAIASNELTICFQLENYQNTDLQLHLVCSNVYNNSQKIRIYACGQKIGNITCTQNDTGKEQTITIPQDTITDGKLIIRMVFPGAVTLNQLDRTNADTRILSVAFDSIWLDE